ncbi:MAG TPA: glycosyltransferase family 1 protein [Candidatus Eisenbacteria bacterium]|nr:glycosyltransferase family 1 protein [Candidatus Eisenbacteria bacterium]
MRIAYDLRYASDHFTGIGTHAWCLFRELLELPGDERYVALWNPGLPSRRYDIARFVAHPRVTWREAPIAPLGLRDPWAVGDWLRRERPDLYVSPFYVVPFGAPCPVVVTLHDVWPLRMPRGLPLLRRALFRASLARLARARLVLTSSEFSRQEILHLTGLDASRVAAVRLGVPPPSGGASERPAGAPDGAFALVVGDNRPRKNLALLARVWAGIAGRAGASLVSAGPVDPRYPSLSELARRAGDDRQVVTLGWVSDPELRWLYAHAAVVLFPSRYEGFGLPMVEAFASGTPVIAADTPTLAEVGDGAAWLADPDDVSCWSAALARLLDDPEERARRAAAGRRRAAELDYRVTAERTLAWLRAVAS